MDFLFFVELVGDIFNKLGLTHLSIKWRKVLITPFIISQIYYLILAKKPEKDLKMTKCVSPINIDKDWQRFVSVLLYKVMIESRLEIYNHKMGIKTN